MMGLIYLLEASLGAVRFEGWAWETIPPAKSSLGCSPGWPFFWGSACNEETLSRGYQLQNLVDGLGLRWGLFLSSAIFAALHLGNPNVTWYTVIPRFARSRILPGLRMGPHRAALVVDRASPWVELL